MIATGNQGSRLEGSTRDKPASGRRDRAASAMSLNRQRREDGADSPRLNQQNHQRQHDNKNDDSNNNNNNNNSNDNNNGRIRLLIAPVVPERSCGSKQQVVGKPKATKAELLAGSQSPIGAGVALNGFREKSYHHYDYYTDSDLTASLIANQTTSNHYEENILLFATEHNDHDHDDGNNHAPLVQKKDANQRQVSQYLNGARHKQQLAGVHGNSDGVGRTAGKQSASSQMAAPGGGNLIAGQTGRFVNYYPSWRQTKSPTMGRYQNYSFHVPLNLQNGANRQQTAFYQSRYSFVTPISAHRQVALGATNGQQQHQRPSSFSRSRTISHLPNMVKISVEDTTVLNAKPKEFALEGPESAYEDFYDRPSIGKRQFIKSDGDLLKAHLVELRLPDEGLDNPFKPGTELSWEADMMVKLMKRGYPVGELPVLVQTAKQVARDKSSSRQHLETACAPQVARLQQPKSGTRGQSAKSGTWSHKETRSKPGESLEQCPSSEKLIRRQSSDDLSSGKQVWANSLNKTKSVPRLWNSRHSRDDADSIDKLITSIELEMSELLRSEADEEQVSTEVNQSSRLFTSGLDARGDRISTLTGNGTSPITSASNRKQRRKSSEQSQLQQQPKTSPASRSRSNKPKSDLSGNLSETQSNKKADLISYKTKRKDARCCTIQ